MPTRDYLCIPRRLVVELRDNPLALALYFLVARLYLVTQRPVALSRGDILRFDPATKVGAIKRALDRLLQAGWLVQTAGYKTSYTPAWGKSRSGMPYLWQLSADYLGCPKHVQTIRIDRALLDVFLGKFTPHQHNPLIERYFSEPLLHLFDVGSYITIVAGIPVDNRDHTRELERWGLVCDGQAQLIPDDAVVLALASQRASVGGFQLNEEGWRVLGWRAERQGRVEEQQEVAPAPPSVLPQERIGELIATRIGEQIGCPLIVLPQERIGELISTQIGHRIGCACSTEGRSSASEREKTEANAVAPTNPIGSPIGCAVIVLPQERIGGLIATQIGQQIGCACSTEGRARSASEREKTETDTLAPTMQGISRDSQETRESPPNPPQREHGGGGSFSRVKQVDEGPGRRTDNETTRLLRSVHAHPASIAELASMSAELVAGAIAYAQSETGIASVAGWVVDALRKHRDEGWPIPTLRKRANPEQPIDFEAYQSGLYGDLFRLGSDLSDLEQPVRMGGQVSIQAQTRELGPPGMSALAHEQRACLVSPQPRADAHTVDRSLPSSSRSWPANEEVTQQIRGTLLSRCERSYHKVIGGLEVRLASDRTIVYCQSVADRLEVLGALMGAVRCAVADLGLPADIAVTDGRVAPAAKLEQRIQDVQATLERTMSQAGTSKQELGQIHAALLHQTSQAGELAACGAAAPGPSRVG